MSTHDLVMSTRKGRGRKRKSRFAHAVERVVYNLAESKFVFSFSAAATFNTGAVSFALIPVIAQGSEENQRIGSEIFAMRNVIKMNLTPPAVQFLRYRFIVWRPRGRFAVSGDQLFDTAEVPTAYLASLGTAQAMIGPLDWRVYDVMYDRTWIHKNRVSAATAGTSTYMNDFFFWEFDLRMFSKYIYSDDTLDTSDSFMITWPWYLTVLSDNATNTTYDLSYMFSYKDV